MALEVHGAHELGQPHGNLGHDDVVEMFELVVANTLLILDHLLGLDANTNAFLEFGDESGEHVLVVADAEGCDHVLVLVEHDRLSGHSILVLLAWFNSLTVD